MVYNYRLPWKLELQTMHGFQGERDQGIHLELSVVFYNKVRVIKVSI